MPVVVRAGFGIGIDGNGACPAGKKGLVSDGMHIY